jgi:UDP-N-acetylmuramoyl-L-alanyl-D-glutamate--2,6-diaminopimelate ligase
MRWSLLAEALGIPAPKGLGQTEVTGITYDSRKSGPGSVFVAIRGQHRDGHRFVAESLARGALVAVAEKPPEGVDRSRLVLVPNSRAALAVLAATYFGHPSSAVPVVGVTGTDGKTTTATLLHSALSISLGTVGSLSTVDFRIGREVEPNRSRQTTLESPELQGWLRRMVDRGCRAIVVEATSHGLALGRLDGIRFAGAVYTNITHEHLDFHGTWEAYFEAKSRLLERSVAAGGFAVLNRDDSRAYPLLLPRAGRRRLSYSASGAKEAELRAESVRRSDPGLTFTATTPAGRTEVALEIPGRWNVGNALAALGAGLLLEQPLEELVAGLGSLKAVPGRMESVELGQPFQVIVDYAHTPAALTVALHELRAATAGRLWVVFGSAGERDIAKRAEMGRIAVQLADLTVVTSEDPRGEDPEQSVGEIFEAAVAAGGRPGENLRREPDRAAAIRLAISGAALGDTVLLAGKGHEASIIGADGPVPWSERGTAEAAILERLGR